MPTPAITASLPALETPTLESPPEPTPEPPQELDLEELIQMSGIAYYGDLALCQMPPEQASAFIDTIEAEMDRLKSIEISWTDEEVTYLGYAALFDAGNGIPEMLFIGGGLTSAYADRITAEGCWFEWPWKGTIWGYADGTVFSEDPIVDLSSLGYADPYHHLDNDDSIYIRDDNALQIRYSNPSAIWDGVFPFVDGRVSSTPTETNAIYEPGYGGKGSGYMVNEQELSFEEYLAWTAEKPGYTPIAGFEAEEGGPGAYCWGLSPMDDVLKFLYRIADAGESHT